MSEEVGKNLRRQWIQVKHSELIRYSDDSPYRSECPHCAYNPPGILLVVRTNGGLSRLDHCSGCGQQYIYTDDTINGEALSPTIEECLVGEIMGS
jgi:hypothetical protein